MSDYAGIELTTQEEASSERKEILVTEPEKKQVLKSLLDHFLEVAAEDKEAYDPEGNKGNMTLKLLEEVESFIVQVAKCYQGYGCPTHTVEVNLVKVAEGLGVKAQVLVFPSQIFIQVDDTKTEAGITKRHSQFFRTSSGYNFYKLQLVDELVRRIASYAQDSETAAQTQEVQPDVANEAFQRAGAFTRAASLKPTSGSGKLYTPLPTVEEGKPLDLGTFIPETEMQANQFSPIEINYDSTDVSDKTAVSPELEDAVLEKVMDEGLDDNASVTSETSTNGSTFSITPNPPFHMLLSRLTINHGQSRSPSPSKLHGSGKRAAKLARMILTLASFGPNAYTVEDEGNDIECGETPHNYHHLFSKLAVEDGIRLIRAIIKQKPLYSIGFKIFMTGVSSFGSCGIFFGGSWLDCAFSFVLGVMIALIELISIVSPTFSRIYEFVATFAASFIIRAVSAYYPHICYRAVLLSTIVFVLQGATITMAFVDIMTKDIITGTTRVFFGMLISALIGYAMDISTSTYASMTDRSYDSVVEDSVCENLVSPAWYPLMFLIMAVGFNILLEAHRNQLPPMIFITACSYLVYYYLTKVIDNQFPTILAAFTASLLSNLYSRRTGQPAVVYIIPAIFLLVPGSVAASSFYTVLLLDLNGGLNLTFAVVTGALSVAIGIFAASALAPVPDVEEFFRKVSAAYPGPHSKRDTARVRREKDFNSGLKF